MKLEATTIPMSSCNDMDLERGESLKVASIVLGMVGLAFKEEWQDNFKLYTLDNGWSLNFFMTDKLSENPDKVEALFNKVGVLAIGTQSTGYYLLSGNYEYSDFGQKTDFEHYEDEVSGHTLRRRGDNKDFGSFMSGRTASLRLGGLYMLANDIMYDHEISFDEVKGKEASNLLF